MPRRLKVCFTSVCGSLLKQAFSLRRPVAYSLGVAQGYDEDAPLARANLAHFNHPRL
jgi:hypothetical protein